MNERQATNDLALVERILDATQRRVDPQMFHFIIWGTIVLAWYPLENWLAANDRGGQAIVAVVAISLGATLSALTGFLANRSPRLAAADPDFGSRIGLACSIFIGTGVVCSICIGVLGGDSRWTPHLWGLIYALMLMTLGVFYSAECFWFGILALAGTIVAAWRLELAGYILGFTMGPAALIPGLIAERRVRRLQRETLNVGDG
jgi:hypothetical protein